MKDRCLIVVAGPTAVGKTALSIRLAKEFDTEILSADSRQFYREMSIGTAKPDPAEMQGVPHHFIDCSSVTDLEPYNASTYEKDGLLLLDQLFHVRRSVILTGGSGLYINALCQGFDEEVPAGDPQLREELDQVHKSQGLEGLQHMLKALDPAYYATVDQSNYKRLIRAIEVCRLSGKRYSDIRRGQRKERPFHIIKVGLELERDQLYDRINKRVDQMIGAGLAEEVRALLPYAGLNALNTVGYQELFSYFKGELSLEEAIEKIKVHTRRYAKRQLTWFKKDREYRWFRPDQYREIIDHISEGGATK